MALRSLWLRTASVEAAMRQGSGGAGVRAARQSTSSFTCARLQHGTRGTREASESRDVRAGPDASSRQWSHLGRTYHWRGHIEHTDSEGAVLHDQGDRPHFRRLPDG